MPLYFANKIKTRYYSDKYVVKKQTDSPKKKTLTGAGSTYIIIAASLKRTVLSERHGTDRRMDKRTDGRIAASFNVPHFRRNVT